MGNIIDLFMALLSTLSVFPNLNYKKKAIEMVAWKTVEMAMMKTMDTVTMKAIDMGVMNIVETMAEMVTTTGGIRSV